MTKLLDSFNQKLQDFTKQHITKFATIGMQTLAKYLELYGDIPALEDTCPVCRATLRPNTMYLTCVYGKILEEMYRKAGTTTIDIYTLPFPVRTIHSNFYKLKHWGLVAQHFNAECKPVQNWYYITSKGVSFLKNEISVPKTLYRFRDETIGQSELCVFFRDIMQSKYRG